MSLSQYTTAVSARVRGTLTLWVEIEGLPYAYGTHARDSSWFSGRAAESQFLGVKAWLAKDSLPALPEQRLDMLAATVEGGALEIRIVDVDDSLASYAAVRRSDGWLRLDADLAVGGASTGTTGSTSGWPTAGGSIAYIGRETVTFSRSSSTLTFGTRGAFRSTASSHDGPSGDDDERTLEGEIVSQYPRFIEGRRVWVYAGHGASAETDCACLWSGVIEETRFEAGTHRTWVLSCSNGFAEINQPVLGDLGSFGLPQTLAEPWRFIVSSRDPGDHVETNMTFRFSTLPVPRSFGASSFEAYDVNGRRDAIADDWQIMNLSTDMSTAANVTAGPVPARYDRTPDYLGTTLAGGHVGSFWREALVIDTFAHSGFDLSDAHPLQVLLHFLTSTKDGGNGTYDTLKPDGWGLGIPEERIDVAGIEAWIDRTSGLRVSIVVTEPIEDFGAWARRSLLQPFGFFFRPSIDNKLSVGRMTTPTPSEIAAAPTLDTSNIVEIGEWSSDVDSIVGEVVWTDNQQPTPDGWRAVDRTTLPVIVDGRPLSLQFPKARTIEVESLGTAVQVQGTSTAIEYMQAVASRFGAPTATIALRVTFDQILREVGDLVRLTVDTVPDPASGRGATDVLCEVVSKRVDFEDMLVDLTVRMTAAIRSKARSIAPALRVTGVASDDITVSTSEYVASGQDATDAFAVGDFVVAYFAKTMERMTATAREIVAIASPVVTLDDGTDVTDDCVLLHADYNEWDATASDVGDLIAFRARFDETLPTGGFAGSDDAHEHG